MESKGEFAAGVLRLLGMEAESSETSSPTERLKQTMEKHAPHLLGGKAASQVQYMRRMLLPQPAMNLTYLERIRSISGSR